MIIDTGKDKVATATKVFADLKSLEIGSLSDIDGVLLRTDFAVSGLWSSQEQLTGFFEMQLSRAAAVVPERPIWFLTSYQQAAPQLLKMQFAALRSLESKGQKNVRPLVQTLDLEAYRAARVTARSIGAPAEIGAVITAPTEQVKDIIADRPAIIAIDLDAMTKVILGRKKAGAGIATVFRIVEQLIEKCRKAKVPTLVFGRICSNPAHTERFVKSRVTAIAVDPGVLRLISYAVAAAEKEEELDVWSSTLRGLHRPMRSLV